MTGNSTVWESVLSVGQVRASESVVLQLRGMVAAGDVQPGDRLPTLAEMARLFKVSKTTVAEALRVLAAQGVVEVRHGSGTYVRAQSEQMVLEALDLYVSVTKESVEKLYELRRMIEPEMARLAAACITPDELQRLEQAVERMMECTKMDQVWMDAHLDFHRLLNQAARNEVAASVAHSLHRLTMRLFPASAFTPERLKATSESYLHIVEALRNSDPTIAAKAVQTHLDWVLRLTQDYGEDSYRGELLGLISTE